MPYQRTQIYLDPEDHRRLVDEAHRRGMSLAALIRELVRERLSSRSFPAPDGFGPLIGVASSAEPTDVAAREDAYLEDALDDRYRKKMGYRPDGFSGG